ncbi:hypothetical protein ACQP00_11305 [Dactylosporangium sp. CS-047395]|uniref:hypothetical protein n=1 Tax=Dactylosporangium sp. CS-047395 TaxID=3239936 RepID=UPI003D8C6F40
MRMRWPLAIAAWLAAAALATAVSIGAVGLLTRGLFGPSDAPLTEADVAAELTPTPSTSAPAAQPTPSANTRAALATDGGSIVASCTDGQAFLESWIPRSGYEADHVQRGPAPAASLRFKARSGGGQVRAQVTCPDGSPVLTLSGDD